MPSAKQLTGAFLVIGIVLRLREYFFDRSLWNDETELVLNILHHSPAGLMKPLDDYQVAPVGFLWLEKLAVHFLGNSELSLRLLPLLGGVASLFLFLALARRILRGTAVPIAVGLFAISTPLIYYASEVKPYATDVAVALAIYLVTDALFTPQIQRGRAILAALIGSVALWLSFPALFLLAGIGLTALWSALRQHRRSSLLWTCLVSAIWAGSFLLLFATCLHAVVGRNHALIDYWHSAYAPVPPHSASDLLWYEDAFLGALSYPCGLALTGIAAVAALIGANQLRSREFTRLLVLLLPLAMALLASALHRYPFVGRFILFAVPALLLLIAEGLNTVRESTLTLVPALSVLLIGFLFLNPAIDAARCLIRPQGVEEVRAAIDYIQSHRVPGDVLYCYYSAELPLAYYRERGRIAPMEQINGIAVRNDWQAYNDDLSRLRGRTRVWVLFSHAWRGNGADEEMLILNDLDHMGRRLDGMQATGAAAFLYDLRTHGFPAQ